MKAFFSVIGGLVILAGIILFIPILLLLVLGEMICGIFGIKFKDEKGEVIKSWVHDKSNLGLAVLLIPVVFMLLIFGFWGITYVFFWFGECFNNGHPILIICGVVIPLLGVGLVVNGAFRK